MSEKELAIKILADNLATDQDTARKMMNKYRNFAGSRSKEVEKALKKAQSLQSLNPFGQNLTRIKVHL